MVRGYREKISRCPICGGNPKTFIEFLVEFKLSKGLKIGVQCTNCGFEISEEKPAIKSFDKIMDALPDLIRKWNTYSTSER